MGHVDTWTAWVNSSNSAVVEAVDWVGTDAYPYFQGEEANSVDVCTSFQKSLSITYTDKVCNQAGADLFFAAYDATVGAAQGKPVWVTETGWPVAGPELNQARTGPSEARQYWQAVSCRLQSSDVNFWWFTLDDDQATSDDVSFSLVNPDDLFGEPLFDLSCDAQNDDDDSTSSSSATASMTGSVIATITSATETIATRTPTGTDEANLATLTIGGSTTVVPDVTFSTFGGSPALTSTGTTGAVTGTFSNGTATGVAPVTQTTTPAVYDGGAMRSGSIGGLAGFAVGLAALIL